MLVRQRKFLNSEPAFVAVADRVIDRELREVIQWVGHFFQQNKGQFLNTNLLPKFTFVNNFVVRVLNAFVKPCLMEQGGTRFNEFAG